MSENERDQYIDELKKMQSAVEKIRFSVGQRGVDGKTIFYDRLNNLLDDIFDLRTNKIATLSTLRAKTRDYTVLQQELAKDYEAFSINPDKFLKEYNEKLNRVEKRGGTRQGAGRPSLGVKKSVTITLPQEAWDQIDGLIKNGEFKNYPEYFRSLMKKGE